MDLFILDGMKALFRLGQALLVSYHRYFVQYGDGYQSEATENIPIHFPSNPSRDLWLAIRRFTHGSLVSWDDLVSMAYSKNSPRRKIETTTELKFVDRIHTPRRRVISKLMDRQSFREDSSQEYSQETELQRQRLWMVQHKPIEILMRDQLIPKALLLNKIAYRFSLALWLPDKLQTCKLELIYSTNTSPPSIQGFYKAVKNSNHTLVVLKTRGKGNIVGMYASQEWSIQPRAYGDGQCFLFQLFPTPCCYKWSRITNENATTTILALNQQFMIAVSKYFAMGGSTDGGFGLRIEEDLTKAYSSRSVTFSNDPLGGEEFKHNGFEIEVLEVYRFVEDLTGTPVR
jgi:hypothetical protein